VANTEFVIGEVKDHFKNIQHKLDEMDGISMDFDTWRFNLRSSNTEPLLRLNVESRGDQLLMIQKRDELLEIINR
jgi:phosphomannomutase